MTILFCFLHVFIISSQHYCCLIRYSLTVDHVEKPLKVDSKNLIRIIVILVRTHPGESPASFVCQGVYEIIVRRHRERGGKWLQFFEIIF